MSTNIISTWIVGKRGLLAEGIIASVEQSFFKVRQCCEFVSELNFAGLPCDDQHLCMLIIEPFASDLDEVCASVASLRKMRPGAFIVCIAIDLAIDDTPLIAAGANGCFSGRFTSTELNMLLSFILSDDRDLSVVFAPRGSATDRPRLLPALPNELKVEHLLKVERSVLDQIVLDDDRKQRTAVALSKREREVLVGLVNGDSNKALARRLLISEATVKAHVRTIFRKLGAHSRTQAVRNLLESCPPGSTLTDWLMMHGADTSISAAG